MKQNFGLLVATIVAVIVSCNPEKEKIDQEISSSNTIQKLEELTGLKWKPVDLDTMKIKPGYIPYDSLVIWAQDQHKEVISRVDTPLTYEYSLVRWRRKGRIDILSTEIFQLSYKFPAKINFELNLKTENGTAEYYLNAKFNFESLFAYIGGSLLEAYGFGPIKQEYLDSSKEFRLTFDVHFIGYCKVNGKNYATSFDLHVMLDISSKPYQYFNYGDPVTHRLTISITF